MSKLDQLRALGEAKRAARSGLRIAPKQKSGKPTGDGIALTSIAHPPGLIDKIAGAIKSGKLGAPAINQPKSNKLGAVMTRPARQSEAPILKRGRPKVGGKRPWDIEGISKRTWYRRKREAEKTK